ncbi:MAG TPA: enoyl-CoA hydratase/isomerase family protein, partial [Thermoanaerobaculia bacterium]|nr:enoyl-CoA hydratase/isomerase family protein [Thermoanaerobaculia bacterium]
MDTLRTEPLSEYVLLLTLDRPQVRNAIDGRMAAELGGFFRSLGQAAGSDVRAVVVTGAGSAFCAGADLKERLGMTEEVWIEHHLFLEEAFAAIRRCPVPLVAAVNGAAIGGGCELMLACDL